MLQHWSYSSLLNVIKHNAGFHLFFNYFDFVFTFKFAIVPTVAIAWNQIIEDNEWQTISMVDSLCTESPDNEFQSELIWKYE